MRFSLAPYTLRLVAPITTAHGVVTERKGALLAVVAGGHVGWGDLCPLPGWSHTGLAALQASLRGAVKDPIVSRELMVGSLAAHLEARAALVGALADLDAKRAGLPLAAALTETPLSSVLVNALVTATDVEGVRREAEQALVGGFSSIKIKVAATDLDTDLARVAAVREVVGDAVEIRLDANGGWRRAEAAAALERLAESHISFCEEPTTGIDAIAALGASSPIPLAVDESARSIADIERALALGVEVVVIKPQALGGPDLAMRAVRLARKAGAIPIITTMIDSAVGVAHALAVAAAAKGELAHGLATSTQLRLDVADPLVVVAGHLAVPQAPGLGVSPG